MNRKIRWIIWVILLSFIGILIYLPGGGEWYAKNIYPIYFSGFSFISSFFPFSLGDSTIVVLVIALGWGIIRNKGLKNRLLSALETLVVTFVWVYLAWTVNYFRADFYSRTGFERQKFSEEQFGQFLERYTENLNETYCEIDTISYQLVDQTIKSGYNSLDSKYGLLKPSDRFRPKPMLFNWVQSSVGVLGYFNPFFTEYHLNRDLLPSQYASVYAHEMSHVLGVSSEAEANFYGYKMCTESSVQEIRFSGYFGLFPYVLSTVRRAFPEEKRKAWLKTIRPEILKLYNEKCDHWESLRKSTLDKVQSKVYDLHLKTNGIRTGLANYGEVIGLVIAAEEAE